MLGLVALVALVAWVLLLSLVALVVLAPGRGGQGEGRWFVGRRPRGSEVSGVSGAAHSPWALATELTYPPWLQFGPPMRSLWAASETEIVPSPLASTAASAVRGHGRVGDGRYRLAVVIESVTVDVLPGAAGVRRVIGGREAGGSVVAARKAGRGDRAAHPEDEQDRARFRPDRSCEDGCA